MGAHPPPKAEVRGSNPLGCATFRPIVPTVHVSTHCYPELFGV
mgnify:CR=1 FL=1